MPIKTWSFACQGNKVKEIHWIPSRNSAFIVVDEYANLYIWDLLADDTQSISSKKLNEYFFFLFINYLLEKLILIFKQDLVA